MFSSRVGARTASWPEVPLANFNSFVITAFNTAILADAWECSCRRGARSLCASHSLARCDEDQLSWPLSALSLFKEYNFTNHLNWQVHFPRQDTKTFYSLVWGCILVIPLFAFATRTLQLIDKQKQNVVRWFHSLGREWGSTRNRAESCAVPTLASRIPLPLTANCVHGLQNFKSYQAYILTLTFKRMQKLSAVTL